MIEDPVPKCAVWLREFLLLSDSGDGLKTIG